MVCTLSQAPISLILIRLQPSSLGSCIASASVEMPVLRPPALPNSRLRMERQRRSQIRPSFPSPTRALSTDPIRLYCDRLSRPIHMSVGYLKLGVSLFPRVSPFLLSPLLLPSVPRNCRTSTLRPRTVDHRCRRYPPRLPFIAS